MAEYIPDISIPSTEYVSVNTLSGVLVGTAMNIQLKSSYNIRLIESATKPADNVTDGLIMSNLFNPYAVVTTKTLSLEIWAITISSSYDKVSKLNIQEA